KKPERRDTVSDSDLLAVFVGSPVVTNWNFVDGTAQLGDFRSHFDLKTESRRVYDHASNNVALKGFVTSLNVGHVEICQQIGCEGQNLVGKIVIEIQHSRGSFHDKAR